MAKTTPANNDRDTSTSGSTPFIDKNTANDAYVESKRWLRIYFDPIDEFERIARNKPSLSIPKELPKVTDGTLAAIVQEQPKRIAQQIATGAVDSKLHPEYAAVADVVLTDKLIPMYNRQGNLLQKSWNMIGKAMTWGRATSYTFFTSTDGQFHTDFVIPYVKDVITEKGKVYTPDCNIRFLRSWYQKRDIQAIINKEKALMAKYADYKSDWDLKLLADFMEAGASAKPAEVMTPAEREKGGDTGGFEVIHAFQVGQNAEFYSFSPQFQDGTVFRTKRNQDPRGHIPLDDLYCNIDLSNPLGRGQVELSGGIQNLIDQQMQMYQFTSTLMQAPPAIVFGNANKATMKMKPNAVWDGGNAANRIEFVKVDNTQIANFPNNYGLLKSQILNLNSAQDHSISSDAGNPSQSKTQAGVQAQEQRLSISDNYLRKQYEAWYGKQAETSLNIFFSEMVTKETIDLGPQELKRLQNSPASKFVKNDKLNINYKDVDDVIFEFQVDPSSTKEADDQDQLQKIQEILTEVGQDGLVLNYYLSQDGMKLNVGELYKQRFERLGLKNIDAILTEMEPKEAEAAKQQPFPIIDKPQIRINTADLTAEQITAALQAGGVNLPQQPGMQPPTSMPAGLSPQGQADFIVEMTKAQAQAQSGQPVSTDPNELAIKHRELDLKQQDLAIKAHDSVSKAQQADDTHQFNVEKAAVDTLQNDSQQQQSHDLAQQQADTAAQQAPQPQNEATETPQQESQESPDQQLQEISQVDGPLQPGEEQIVRQLLQMGFDENDAEQAITMLRQGVPEDQIIKTLGAKRGVPA